MIYRIYRCCYASNGMAAGHRRRVIRAEKACAAARSAFRVDFLSKKMDLK